MEARPQVMFCDMRRGWSQEILTLKLLVHVPAMAQVMNPNQHKGAEQIKI
jgi:hypothetical protein